MSNYKTEEILEEQIKYLKKNIITSKGSRKKLTIEQKNIREEVSELEKTLKLHKKTERKVQAIREASLKLGNKHGSIFLNGKTHTW